ncbi:hypothetical protein [Caproiciproducens galactitolivorans]|uniref:Flp pilus-assembly TadG-like N-terminal domain-containing protein n=1 Tax=Caproiciproducens galactitolivorans TaxID=642589 RepID=A0ABT4BU52_9FIRM|nr:hypothetical protein [Caproiciproducens galactitolivorans]MCY1714425.1 hypothetical protein [Caproiciproducens galactitolivorans]
MKIKSKRGAALAYVIIITAVMMVLASALILTAKANLEYTKNSLEGRQAYLDAKSAIEYAKAYLVKCPDSDDFSIVRNAGGSTFSVGSPGAADAIAVYNSKNKVINASAKYQSSDRVRKLGYQFSQDGEVGTNDFLVASQNYGKNLLYFSYGGFFSNPVSSLFPKILFNTHLPWDDSHQAPGGEIPDNWWNMIQNVSKYPVLFPYSVRALYGESYTLKAPQILLFGEDYSALCDEKTSIELNSDVIYIQSDIDVYSFIPVARPKLILKNSGRGVVVFQRDCKVDSIQISEGCYSFKSGTDLFKPKDVASLKKLNEIPDYAKVDKNVLEKPRDIISGDVQFPLENGAGWSLYGKIPDFSTSLESGEGKIVYWYLNDVSKWDTGKGRRTYDYSAKEIHLRYVSDNNIKISKDKTILFKADSVTLSFSANLKKNLPEITQSGPSSFLLKAAELSVSDPITVRYSGEKGPSSYEIRAGLYDSTPELNLFSEEARDYFKNTKPKPYSGENADMTGGVYTDGQ